MSSEWQSAPFSKFCDITRGASPRPIHDYLSDEGMSWIKIADATAENSRFISSTKEKIKLDGVKASVKVFPNDLILSNSATPGLPKFLKIEACIHDGWMLLRNFRDLDIQYAYWLLLNERPKLVAQGNGSVFTNLKTDILKSHIVTVPPLSIQKDIAAMLNNIDDRITNLRETNATLEAIAQALFKSWFVDFDPVRAKSEGKLPDGLDEATAALFPDAFDETELGLVPKGWSYVPFGQLITQTIGGDWGSDVADEKNDTRVAIIRGTDIPDLQAGAGNRVPIRFTTHKKLATRKLEDGDLVIEVSGGSKEQPTGRSMQITTALLDKFDCPVEPASFCRLMRPTNKKISTQLAQHLSFIYAQGKTWEYQNQSTGIANFQTTHFLQNEMVVLPTESISDAFSNTVQALMDRTETLEIQVLSTLRDTLLPRLISGQLRISDAEAELEKVTA